METGSKIKVGDVIPPARLLLAQQGHDVVMLTCKSVLIYLKCFIVQVFCNVIHIDIELRVFTKYVELNKYSFKC